MAGRTASRAVVFSGFTVVIALLGMFIVPHTIFRSLAWRARSLVVLIAVAHRSRCCPRCCRCFGDRIEKGRIWPQEHAEGPPVLGSGPARG